MQNECRKKSKGRICLMDFFNVFLSRSWFNIFFWLLPLMKQVFFSVWCESEQMN